MRAGDPGIADVRDEENAALGIEREPVRTHADADLERLVLAPDRKDGDRVLPPVGREDEVVLVGDERPRDAREPLDGANELPRGEVDHVHRVVRRVRDVEAARRAVNGRVVEAALLHAPRELDAAARLEHGFLLAGISGRTWPASRSW